MWDCPIDR
uniref:Uncharacterized protein n=1 Tax=Arundo donax TaxID=35708 RepID=A0A0A8YNN5_ARUDO